MAEGGKPSFGLPQNWDKIPENERKQLLKPLIFPNSERLFKRFTFGVTLEGGVLKALTNGVSFYDIFNDHIQCKQSTALTIYMVFFHEYRSKDHCFRPIRQWAAKQKVNFFSLEPEELEYVEKRKKELKEL